MITSIVVPERYKIGIDRLGRFMLDETKISIKDVPFVRYRFDRYFENDIDYIKEMMKKFNYSTHLAEINMTENFDAEIEMLTSNIDNLVIFVYIDVDDNDIANNNFKESQLNDLNKLLRVMPFVERVLIRDKSTTMHKVSGDRLKKILCSKLKIKESMIGFCQSPLSLLDGQACLTAAKARELAVNYNNNEDCPVPSANHERKTSCFECCGCIRYEVVDHDIRVEETEKPKVKKDPAKRDRKEDEAPKEKKVVKRIPKGAIRGFNIKL